MMMSYVCTGDTKDRICSAELSLHCSLCSTIYIQTKYLMMHCTCFENHKCLHGKYFLSTKENSFKPTRILHWQESSLVNYLYIQRRICSNTGLRIDKRYIKPIICLYHVLVNTHLYQKDIYIDRYILVNNCY